MEQRDELSYRYPIVEVFGPTVQGEGLLVGRLSLFVRLGGCDYRCCWCDTMYAVDARQYAHTWQRMTLDEVVAAVQALASPPVLVTLSGGNPAIHPLAPLVRRLRSLGYAVACETQGSIACEWFRELDVLVLSPKPPSAGQITPVEAVRACVQVAPDETHLKIVVFGREDYLYARAMFEAFPHLPAVIQLGTPTELQTPQELVQHYRDLTALVLRWLHEDRLYRVRLLPQLHRVLFEATQGV